MKRTEAKWWAAGYSSLSLSLRTTFESVGSRQLQLHYREPCEVSATSGSVSQDTGRSCQKPRVWKLLAGARPWLGSQNVMSAFFIQKTECRFTYCCVMSCTIGRDRLIRMNKGQTGKTTTFALQDLPQLSAAIAAGAVDCGWEADLVHVNDWPAALVPAYLHWNARPLPSILTIHNLAYQGLFSRSTLDRIGAPENSFHVDEIEIHGKVSFLKGGIVHATHVTTVSQTYTRESTTPDCGCGLAGLLRRRAECSELTGMLNGIDESWNSLTCPDLVNPFEAGDWDGKRCNTVAVRRKFGLALSDGPLFGLVARLVHQKGIDLVLAAAEMIVDAGGQLVVIGTGEPRFERELEETSCRFPRAVGVNIGFDSGDARRIFAGSDFTLVPSRFEPCGLSQMYAQRFGSLPIGLETGGLAETIEDGKTGFLFRNHSVGAFVGALYRALSVFDAKSKLNAMRCTAMTRAFSWEKSVQDYTGLYERALEHPGAGEQVFCQRGHD